MRADEKVRKWPGFCAAPLAIVAKGLRSQVECLSWEFSITQLKCLEDLVVFPS